MSATTSNLTACPNCGAPLTGAFCAHCGQKVAPINPTLHDFLHDAVHEFLHVDGRILRSVQYLLLRPGFITREYFAGRRASYLTAIRLYLLFSVLYFGVAAIAPDRVLDIRVSSSGDPADAAELQRLGYANEEELREALVHAFQVWAPRAMFVLVPVFAAVMMLTNQRARRNYPQHLIFALHVHAAWFCAAALAVALRLGTGNRGINAIVTVPVSVYAAWYFVRALRTAYNTTTAGAMWRAAVVVSVYVVAIAAVTMAIFLPLVLPR